MNKLFLLLTALSLAGQAQTPTRAERDRAMQHLQATRKSFLESVDGLTEAQWNFKPAADRWSIAECAEHIAVSEDTILGVVTGKLMKTLATPGQEEEVKGKEELIFKSLPDRSQKFQAPEMLRPTARWPNQKALVDHFLQSRDRTIAYTDTTQDDLHGHFFAHPVLKLLDGYQWILLLSTHSERHIAQLNEVKTAGNFPK